MAEYIYNIHIQYTYSVFIGNTSSVIYGADIRVDDMKGVEGGGGKVSLQVASRVQVKMSRFSAHLTTHLHEE